MMGLLERVANAFGYQRRSGTANPEPWFVDWAQGRSTSTGVRVNATTALKYTPFWAAVRIISGTLGSLPFKVFLRDEDGGRREAATHPVYQLLHDAPNDYMDAVTFRETRQAHVLCYGNGYAEIQRDGGGRPIALWPLLPNKTQRKITESGVSYYEVKVGDTGQETVILPDEDVLHIKGLGFDGFAGYDVVSYHKEAIAYGVGVKEYGARFFGNGAAPGGVLEHPNAIGEKALKHLKDSWGKEHQGLSQAHRLQILEEGMKWHETSVDPARAQALEVQKWTVDDCSRIFQIPPHKLGSMEFSKYNNVEQLQIDFVCTTLMYWFCKWEQEINRKLFLSRERGKLFAEILADGLLRGNVEARAHYYATGRQWGFLSINDIHRKENMNPIGPEGDIYLDPLNMVPAGTPIRPRNSDGVSNAIRQAHRELLASQWRRVLVKQQNAQSKGVPDDWWTGHREYAGTVLGDAARAYGSLLGLDARAVNAILALALQRWNQPGIIIDPDKAGCLADDLMAALGGHDATA
jgi:HK97 family phage portal protein